MLSIAGMVHDFGDAQGQRRQREGRLGQRAPLSVDQRACLDHDVAIENDRCVGNLSSRRDRGDRNARQQRALPRIAAVQRVVHRTRTVQDQWKTRWHAAAMLIEFGSRHGRIESCLDELLQHNRRTTREEVSQQVVTLRASRAG